VNKKGKEKGSCRCMAEWSWI